MKLKALKAYGIVDSSGYLIMDAVVDYIDTPTILSNKAKLKRYAKWFSTRQDEPCKVVPITISYEVRKRGAV